MRPAAAHPIAESTLKTPLQPSGARRRIVSLAPTSEAKEIAEKRSE